MTSTSPGDGARRVRVTSPRRDARKRAPRRSVAAEVEAGTDIGAVYVESLLKSQRRLGAATLTVVLATIAGVPLLLMVAPGLRTLSIWWLPLSWLVIGIAMYPLLWLVGRLYVWQAERIEEDFAEDVERAS